MAQHVFRAKLWEHSPEEPGSCHFLTLPAVPAEDSALEGGPGHGFGSIRVEVFTGSTTWRTSLRWSRARGSWDVFLGPVTDWELARGFERR